MDTTTIVTAFYDIGRGSWEGTVNGSLVPPFIKRTNEEYFERFERLLKLKNTIIVFTEKKFFDYFKNLGDIYKNLTVVITEDIFQGDEKIDAIRNVQSDRTFIEIIKNPGLPEYWNAEYVFVNYLKSHFVVSAMKMFDISNENIAWIDFGYCRCNTFVPEVEWKYNCDGKIHLFTNGHLDITQPQSIIRLIRDNEVLIQGCHIIAPKNMWIDFCDDITFQMETLLNVGLVDDDQTLLYMAYRANPDKFKVNEGDSINWFRIFENMDGYHD